MFLQGAAAGELTRMQYNSIMAAIPRFWRRQIAEAKDIMDNGCNAELCQKLHENPSLLRFIYVQFQKSV